MSSSGSFFDELGGGAGAGRDKPGWAVAWWTVVGVLLLGALGYAALAWYAEGAAPRRATVEGIDIGGLSSHQAESTLRDRLSPRLTEPITLSHRGEEVSIVPADAGISIDWEATLRRAGAVSSRTPAELWAHYTGDEDTEAVVVVDPAAMSRVLDGVTSEFDTLAVEGTIDFSTGQAVPVHGKPGLRVDREATAELLEALLFEPGEHELPVESRPPYISGSAVQRALTSFGRPAMSAPVTLVIGRARVVVPPEIVGKSLTMLPSSGQLEPLVDGARLMELLEPRMTTVGDKPRNAGRRVVDGQLVTVPARTGAAWDDSEIASGVLDVLTAPRAQRVVRVQAALTEPRVRDAQARAWGISERVATYSVDLDPVDAPTRAALKRLDNRRIPAGATFSLLDAVTEDGLGPQLRVVGSALFTTAYRLGLGVEERSGTPQRDERFPSGFDLRIDRDHDLRLRNTTPHSVLISATQQDGTLQVSLWSTPHFTAKIWRAPPTGVTPAGTRTDTSGECTPRSARSGFSVKVTRQVAAAAGPAVRDSFIASYQPREGITC